MDTQNISKVVQSQVCTGCSTCFSFCPEECIDIIETRQGIYQPVIDESKCNQCGVCVKVCGNSDFVHKNHVLNSEAEFIGNVIHCYTGFSNWDPVRINSSSGGLVTQLSIFCLENKIVDGVICVDKKTGDPARFEARIYRTIDQVRSGGKSKYIPVPLNQILKEIINEMGKNQYLFIGLPCHLKGLNRAENLSKVLKEKIPLKFGLFCSHTPTTQGTDFLINQCKISKKKIKSISYRDQGWKVAFTARDEAGKTVKFNDFWSKYFGLNFFTAKYCFFCDDLLNRECDLSFGDAWLDEYKEDNKGVSLVISRTLAGENLLRTASQANQIFVNRTNIEKVIQSQKEYYYFKLYMLADRCNKLPNRPQSGNRYLPVSVYNSIMTFHAALTENQFLIFLLSVMPEAFLKVYIKLVRRLLHSLMNKVYKNYRRG